jgi:hypothetical protein
MFLWLHSSCFEQICRNILFLIHFSRFLPRNVIFFRYSLKLSIHIGRRLRPWHSNKSGASNLQTYAQIHTLRNNKTKLLSNLDFSRFRSHDFEWSLQFSIEKGKEYFQVPYTLKLEHWIRQQLLSGTRWSIVLFIFVQKKELYADETDVIK